MRSVVELYEDWDAADPGKGHEAKAAPWRTKAAPAEPPPAGK